MFSSVERQNLPVSLEGNRFSESSPTSVDKLGRVNHRIYGRVSAIFTKNMVQREGVELLKRLSVCGLWLAFSLAVQASETSPAEQNIKDCSHLLISHIRSFPPSWSGFKSINFLKYYLGRRRSATILFRFPIEGYSGLASELLNLDFGEGSLEIIPSLSVFVGPNLYVVGEGTSQQILKFDERFRDRFPAIQPLFQILDSEPLIGDLDVNPKLQHVDLSVQDPETVLKQPLTELKSKPQTGFIVQEEQMNGVVYFFAKETLNPILEIDGFLHANFLHVADAEDSLSLTEAIENHENELLSDEGFFVRWHDLIFMNGVAARAILDLRNQTNANARRSSVRVHSRLIELIRACRVGNMCPPPAKTEKDLIDITMGLIASLDHQTPQAEVKPAPPPTQSTPSTVATPEIANPPEEIIEEPIVPTKRRNVTPAFQRQPKYVRDRLAAVAAAPAAPKRAKSATKPATPKDQKETLPDLNPFSQPLRDALAINSQAVEKIKEDPAKMASWIRSETNQSRLKVAEFYLAAIKPLFDQYDQLIKDQEEVADDAELFGVLKAELSETAEKLKQMQIQLVDELLASDKKHQTVSIDISMDSGPSIQEDVMKLRDMYLNLAKQQQWKAEVVNESLGNRGLRAVSMRIEGRGTIVLEHEAGLHRFMAFAESVGSKIRTSYLKISVDQSPPRAAGSPYVRTYDLRKSDMELEKFLSGEALAQELRQVLRQQAEAKLLKINDSI